MRIGLAVTVLSVSVISAAALACGGPPKARAGHEERLPADGSPGGPAVSQLPPKSIAAEDWNKSLVERIAPTCDAREGSHKADAAKLGAADKIIKEWMAFKKAKGGSRTGDGKQIGGKPEPTRTVESLGMTCSAGVNTVEVNGIQHPFDMAWVISGKGVGPTLNGSEDGAGYFVMIQAVSFKEKNVVLAKVFVPSDGNDDTDDTVVVTDLANYLPANADEPIVRAVSERENPIFETFVFTKGQKEGFTYQAPQQRGFGKARYLAVGRFAVDQK